jgi:hypothetical protein
MTSSLMTGRSITMPSFPWQQQVQSLIPCGIVFGKYLQTFFGERNAQEKYPKIPEYPEHMLDNPVICPK